MTAQTLTHTLVDLNLILLAVVAILCIIFLCLILYIHFRQRHRGLHRARDNELAEVGEPARAYPEELRLRIESPLSFACDGELSTPRDENVAASVPAAQDFRRRSSRHTQSQMTTRQWSAPHDPSRLYRAARVPTPIQEEVNMDASPNSPQDYAGAMSHFDIHAGTVWMKDTRLSATADSVRNASSELHWV